MVHKNDAVWRKSLCLATFLGYGGIPSTYRLKRDRETLTESRCRNYKWDQVPIGIRRTINQIMIQYINSADHMQLNQQIIKRRQPPHHATP